MYAATATFFECLTGRPPFPGETAEALLYQHVTEPVPLDAVPEPLRPLVAAGMAKEPENRPADATTFITALRPVAARAYGPDWPERGRSHLGEAALLLAALWPSGGPAAVQGTTVEQVPLRQHHRRPGSAAPARPRSPSRPPLAVVTAGTALAVGLSRSSTSSYHASGGHRRVPGQR